MYKARLAVLLSGEGSNLQALIDATQKGIIKAEIVLVVSNKFDAGGLKRAQKSGIENIVLDNLRYADRRSFDCVLESKLKKYNLDLIILAGFMRILTSDFVEAFAGRILNIHPSLLPKYRGLHTHQKALDAGDKNAGATVHFVTSELDGGPSIIQAVVPILKNDTVDALASRILTKEHQIYPLAVKLFCEGRLSLVDEKAVFDSTVLPKNGLRFTDELKKPEQDIC
jgi:phosphoribosylglycinamide formyltransferase-1